jgi:hypothetical protein
MRFKRSGPVSLLVGVLFLITSGFFFFSGLGFAGLKCVECDCRYDLAIPGCRSPIIYLWMAVVALIGALALLATGLVGRLRNKRPAKFILTQ